MENWETWESGKWETGACGGRSAMGEWVKKARGSRREARGVGVGIQELGVSGTLGSVDVTSAAVAAAAAAENSRDAFPNFPHSVFEFGHLKIGRAHV